MMEGLVIAKYIRLSRDDNDTGSISIPNQHTLLDRYIEEMDVANATILEFVDNGYTGTNFERPAVQEMLELVRSGRVSCIVCKDFSRFGRNILETGYFIEQVFPLYGIRFIAVTDDYDSDNYKGHTGGIDVAFKFLIHEHCSNDLSKKIKSALHYKMSNGELITQNAAYGYFKANSGKWEIDENAALVIRLIFKMAVEGSSTGAIRNYLCAAKHPTPHEYKAMKRMCNLVPKCYWSIEMLLRILRNEQYIGTFVSGRTARKHVASSAVKSVDEADWIKIPDRHPAIINKEDFDKVQRMFAKQRQANPRTAKTYLLSGKVICGCCGRRMTYDGKSRAATFRCVRTLADPSARCYKHAVKAAMLDKAVLDIIAKQAEVLLGVDNLTGLRSIDQVQLQIIECETQLQRYITHQQESYEKFVTKEISRTTYQSTMNDYSAQINKINNRLSSLKQASQMNEANEKMVTLADKVVNMQGDKEQREIVDAVIEKVKVFPGYGIEIVWKFVDFETRA